MEWKLLTATFLAIFVAEMGDKTQIATLALSGAGSSRWIVFAGAALALVSASAIAVLAGEAAARLASPALIRRVAGLIFVVIGLIYLLSAR